MDPDDETGDEFDAGIIQSTVYLRPYPNLCSKSLLKTKVLFTGVQV
jgi:hypothetical protein